MHRNARAAKEMTGGTRGGCTVIAHTIHGIDMPTYFRPHIPVKKYSI